MLRLVGRFREERGSRSACRRVGKAYGQSVTTQDASGTSGRERDRPAGLLAQARRGRALGVPPGASASHGGLSCSVSCDPADVRGAPLPSSHIVVITVNTCSRPPSLPPSRSFLGAGLVHVLGHFPAPGTGSAKVRLLRSRMPACRQCGSANASPPGSLAAPPGRPPGPAQAPAVQRAASPRQAAFAVG